MNQRKERHFLSISSLIIVAFLLLSELNAQTTNQMTAPSGGVTPLSKLVAKAEKGDAEAQYNLALAYKYFSLGNESLGKIGYSQGRKLKIETLEALWDMYARDESVVKSSGEASKWFRKAAEQGHIKAQDEIKGKNSGDDDAAADVAEAHQVKSTEREKAPGNSDADTKLSDGMDRYIRAKSTEDKSESIRLLQEAAKLFSQSAEQGQAGAQAILGEMYEQGEGVKKDPTAAIKWYRKSAEQGIAAAQADLGRMYAAGDAAQKNTAEAVKWYRMAMRGEPWLIGDLSFLIGKMYALGDGVEKNEIEAMKWFWISRIKGNASSEFTYTLEIPRIAKADLGDAVTQYSIGSMYGEAIGDPVEAMTWYQKSAEQGLVIAQEVLADHYLKGEGVTKDPAEAMKWYQRAAEQDVAIQYQIGDRYATGDGVARDPVEAIKWYRKAAEHAAWAQFKLGVMYYNGEVAAKDLEEAVKWYRKAAELGHAEAQFALGLMYENGDGVAKNPVEAVKWYRKSAGRGEVSAQYRLGVMYANGDGVIKNPEEAAAWILKAAEQGFSIAQIDLGDRYVAGDGVAKNPVEAVKWYRESAERGEISAQYRLGVIYANSDGVATDPAEGAEWFRKAAVQRSTTAQYCLGVLFATSEGVIKNEIEALAYFYLAKSRGFSFFPKENSLRLNSALLDKGVNSNIEMLEQKLGKSGSSQAQQRAREISKTIVTEVETEPESLREIDMVFVQGGALTLGCRSEQKNECSPFDNQARTVTLGNYYISRFEVTQTLYQSIMGRNPSYFEGGNLPVEQVSWSDTQEFISKLNAATGKHYRLPTEDEWEYAARGGLKSHGYRYSGSNAIDDVAWHYDNSGDNAKGDTEWIPLPARADNRRTHPVGTKRPNELGIHDMSGNVCEWVSDEDIPSIGTSYRVSRGGSWGDSLGSTGALVYHRAPENPEVQYNYIGFRLVHDSK
jgi:TPR repeat protein